jgi:hypothetical protein
MSCETVIAIVIGLVATAGFSTLFYFIGKRDGRKAEQRAIQREEHTHKKQTETIVEREEQIHKEQTETIAHMVVKQLEARGYPMEMITSPVVQDAIRASTNAFLSGKWKGPLAGNARIFETGEHIYTKPQKSVADNEDEDPAGSGGILI